MARKVLNINVYSPFKLHHGLTGKSHAICHYSYNLPLWATYMRPIFLFVLTLSFGFQAKAQLVDDFEVINVQLAEFEKKELLLRDIYI